jgi:uncharacterized protein
VELVNEFGVPASANTAWGLLSDVERIVPCMPGATLDEQHGDEYRGHVGVSIGPVGLSFSGTAKVLDRSDTERRLVVRGSAAESSGQGGVEALITMTVLPDPDPASESSRVRVVTELNLTGRVAQFGTGMINQVNRRIVGQFVKRLQALLADTVPAAQRAAAAPETGTRSRFSRTAFPASRPSRELVAAVATALAGVLLGTAVNRAVREAARARG